MAISQVDTFLGSIAAILLFRWMYSRFLARGGISSCPQPPGPPGLPLIGNLRDLPQEAPWKTYMEWTRRHGSDLVRVSIFGSNMIVVNSYKIASDLFERRSSNYSDRRTAVMLDELCGFQWGLGSVHYGTLWRDSRRAFHHEFHPEATKRFHAVEAKGTKLFLQKVILRPEDFLQHLRYMSAMITIRVAYGIDIMPEDDPFVEIAERGTAVVAATVNAGAYLVDLLPALKYVPEWFPGAGFKKQAREWKKAVHDMRNIPFEASMKLIASGDAPADCATVSLMERMYQTAKDPAYMEEVIAGVVGSTYAAGVDTVYSSIASFILAMVLHPDVQVKAQKEIDRLLGMSRLPLVSDRPSLPYVEAIVNESLRWNPAVPLSIPHVASEDDVYDGYYIPKGSMVIGNSWAILHNAHDYPEPFRFNPDRYIKDGKISCDVRDPSTAAFGYGRRICPGRYMAKDSMFLTIASILATLTISNAVDDNGVPITPPVAYHDGFLSYPKKFPAQLQPRSKEHRVTIEADLGGDQAQRLYGQSLMIPPYTK